MKSLIRTAPSPVPYFPIEIDWEKGHTICFENLADLRQFLTEQGWDQSLKTEFCKDVSDRLKEAKKRSVKPSIRA